MGRPDVHIDLHLVLLRMGCVLMGKRRNTAFAAGQYHVPAGRLEKHETIIDTRDMDDPEAIAKRALRDLFAGKSLGLFGW